MGDGRAPEKTDAEALYNTACKYASGNGVEKDPSMAASLFMASASQGFAPAQFSIGLCYEKGEGVSADPAKAAEWYEKAAILGNAGAQARLALCYCRGFGVLKDPLKTFVWAERAANQGNTTAQVLLGRAYLTGQGVEKDQSKAVLWLKKAAEQGDMDAQYYLARCYLSGQGVQADSPEGVAWLRKAAEQGHSLAQCCLGGCYGIGQGVERDPVRSAEWHEKAAARGVRASQAYLADYCYRGGAVEKNLDKARDLNKAVVLGWEQGIPDPAVDLACDEFLVGLAYCRLNEVEKSVTVFEASVAHYKGYIQAAQASRMSPGQNWYSLANVLSLLGSTYYALGRRQDARQVLEEARKALGTHKSYHDDFDYFHDPLLDTVVQNISALDKQADTMANIVATVGGALIPGPVGAVVSSVGADVSKGLAALWNHRKHKKPHGE